MLDYVLVMLCIYHNTPTTSSRTSLCLSCLCFSSLSCCHCDMQCLCVGLVWQSRVHVRRRRYTSSHHQGSPSCRAGRPFDGGLATKYESATQGIARTLAERCGCNYNATKRWHEPGYCLAHLQFLSPKSNGPIDFLCLSRVLHCH